MITNHNSSQIDPSTEISQQSHKPNWKQVSIFLAVTFGLTWGLDLFLYLNGGLYSPAITLALQLQMLLPAFSAILLEFFFFKDSRIYIRSNHTTSRWFIWYFLVFTLLYIVAFFIGVARPYDLALISSLMLIPSVLGLILLVVLRLVGGKDSFASVGLGGGKPKYWLFFAIGIIAYIGLQTLLCWLFNMGQPVDMALLGTQAAMAGMSLPMIFILSAVQTVLLGPFLGLIITFGEEYAWRGFLQGALSNLGSKWGVLLVGVIWGIWHWPIIWMGYNYPGHPYLGSLLMLLSSVGLAFLLGYAVLKGKGIWIAAFLHALFNQTFSFFMALIYTPTDPSFAFGIGLPAFVLMIPLVLLILRDPVWKESNP